MCGGLAGVSVAHLTLTRARAVGRYSSETLTQNSAAGPTLGDQLVLVFDNELDTTIPANTREEVDALVEIVPRISDIECVPRTSATPCSGRRDGVPDLPVCSCVPASGMWGSGQTWTS